MNIYTYRYTRYTYAVPLLRRRSTQRCPGATAGERGGAVADLHSMRGAQLGCVYWLLCAIYLYAALGSVVASGGSGAVPAQLAASAPALLVGVPVAAGRLIEGLPLNSVAFHCPQTCGVDSWWIFNGKAYAALARTVTQELGGGRVRCRP